MKTKNKIKFLMDSFRDKKMKMRLFLQNIVKVNFLHLKITKKANRMKILENSFLWQNKNLKN